MKLIIIGIAGGSGAGKTTVALAVAEKFGKENVDYLSQDWYYKDCSHMTPDEVGEQNWDHPESFDNQLLISHLNQLRQGQLINVPIFNHNAHVRSSETKPMSPKSAVILEGILALAIPELRSLYDVKVFVDAEPDIRLIRRINRDINERGGTFEKTSQRYLSTIKPMHDAFVEPSKRYADLIVPRGGQNDIAIDLLSDFIEHYVIHQTT